MPTPLTRSEENQKGQRNGWGERRKCWKNGRGERTTGEEIPPLCNPRAPDTHETQADGCGWAKEWLTPKIRKGNLTLNQVELP